MTQVPKLALEYFDFHGGRGEAARLALAIGGIPFESRRLPVADWPARREDTPFHALPLLEVDGEVVSQSNAINRYVGRLSGLYPEDPLEALRCDEVMDAVEDMVTRLVATFGIEDADEMKTARQALIDGPIQLYLTRLEAMLNERGGRYFAADRLTVADLKVEVAVAHLRSGQLDHIPQDLVDRVAPALVGHFERVRAEPGIVAYYEGR